MYDNEQYHDALPLLQAAQKISYRGDTTLVTRFWAAAVSAEAHAGIGNLYACQQALDLAEDVQNTRGGMNGTWLRFDGTRLPEERGACYVKLKQPDLAIPALQGALRHLPSDLTHLRRRSIALTNLAVASIQNRKIDQACSYANDAIDIMQQSSSGMLRKGIKVLSIQLEPFKQADSVRKLDKRMLLLN